MTSDPPIPGELERLGELIAHTAERAGPAVVGLGAGWGVGSGFVVAPGFVLTCAHALRREAERPTVSFTGGERRPGRLHGLDRELDLAVIAVDTGGVEPIPLPGAHAPEANAPEADAPEADAPEVAIGTVVLAAANPGGRGLRVTAGFVSSLPRRLPAAPRRAIAGAIEHTAPLPRGSSGGPLLAGAGTLLGLNAVRVDGGLIAAIPADARLRARVAELLAGERAGGARLGVALAPPAAARRLRAAVGLPARDGVLVRAVQAGSPAGRAGLAPGDLIAAAGGRPVDGVEVLYDALAGASAGGRLRLRVVRGAEEREVTVSLP